MSIMPPQTSAELLDYWLTIPGDVLPEIDLTGLKPYWRRAIIPPQTMDVCPNCLRYKYSPAGGVCDTCRKAAYINGKKLTSWALLANLRRKAEALNPDGLVEEPPEEEPELEKPKVIGKIDLPGEPAVPAAGERHDDPVISFDQAGQPCPRAEAEQIGRASEFDPAAPLTNPIIKRASIFDFGIDELEIKGNSFELSVKIRRQGQVVFNASLDAAGVDAIKELLF